MNDATASDVLVVGGGPAGSVTALLLARAGAAVTLLDRATFPRDKPCAEYLSPGALAALHEIGAGAPAEAAAEAQLDGFLLNAYGRASMRGHFGGAPHWPNLPPYGLGLRRATLDALLLTMARGAGVRVHENVRVVDVQREDRRVTGVRALGPDGPLTRRAAIVVGADGVNGIVGRRLAMTALRSDLRRFALVGHMRGITGLGDCGEMHVGPAGYCGIAPLGHGVANVAMVLPARTGRRPGRDVAGFFRALLEEFTDLAPRARSAKLLEPPLRTGSVALKARRMTGDGVLLVGDAAGFYDPFTGQGVYKAIRSAQLAAPVILDALARGDVARGRLLPYERARRGEFREGHAVEWLIQHLLPHPALFVRAVRRLGSSPMMADTLVGVTGDVLPARRVLSPRFLARLAL